MLQLFGVDLQVERDDVEVGLGREEGPEVRHIARRGAAGGGWAARLAVHEAGDASTPSTTCPAGCTLTNAFDAATLVGSDACACCTTVAGLSRDAAGVCVDATQG